MGRILIALGLVLLIAGLLITLGVRLPGGLPRWLGRLPGDFTIRGKSSVFYFPLATCALVSVILSLVLWLLGRR